MPFRFFDRRDEKITRGTRFEVILSSMPGWKNILPPGKLSPGLEGWRPEGWRQGRSMFNHGAVVLERVTFSQEVVVSPCGGGLGWWI
jgi:hypothetical protein